MPVYDSWDPRRNQPRLRKDSATSRQIQRAMEEEARTRVQADTQSARQPRVRDSWRPAADRRAPAANFAWEKARQARAQRARRQAIAAEAERRRKAEIEQRRRAASAPSTDDILLGSNRSRLPTQRADTALEALKSTDTGPDGQIFDDVLGREMALGNVGKQDLPLVGDPGIGAVSDDEPEPDIDTTKDESRAFTAGFTPEQRGVWNRDQRLSAALGDPVFKAYYHKLLEWKGEGIDADPDDLPLGLDGGLFTDAPEDPEGGAFPSLTDNAPPFLMARDAAGEYKLYDAQEAFDEYQADLEDPRAAGLLAFQLNAAGFYGFDSPASKRLKDRMLVRQTDGGEVFELQWGEEDDEALEAALMKTSRMQATAAEDGNQTDFKDLIEQQAMRGLTHGQEGSEAIANESEVPGVPRNLEDLKPGNYGGYDIDREQAGNLGIIAGVGRSMGVSERDIGIAIITAVTESNIRSLDHGDRDSLGIFQQRGPWGSAAQRQDPNYAASKFFEALKGVKNRDSMSMGDVAQAVQKSAHPEKYAKNVAVAAAVLGGDTFREQSADLKMIGKVKPHALAAAQEISGAFGKDNIGGLAKSGHIDGSDHYTGQAIDVMGAKDGAAIASYSTLNAERWGVKYVIHNRQIWTPKEGWKPYSGANPHTGHVHVSFNGTGGTGSSTVLTAGQAAERALGGGTGGTGGSGGSGGTSGTGGGGGSFNSTPGAVSYADPTEVEQAADNVALDRLGRELDEDEVTDVLNLFHNAQREYQSSASLGISATQPDLMGMVEKYIDDKLNEEAEGQMEGEFAVAAFRLLAGDSGLSGIGI